MNAFPRRPDARQVLDGQIHRGPVGLAKIIHEATLAQLLHNLTQEHARAAPTLLSDAGAV
jgi:hypothetical protein